MKEHHNGHGHDNHDYDPDDNDNQETTRRPQHTGQSQTALPKALAAFRSAFPPCWRIPDHGPDAVPEK